jgi:ketosteroid isomerase-like protein
VSANLDLVRSIYADWERGDFRRTDWAHPAIEMTMPDTPEGATPKGLGSIADAWRTWLSAWRDYRVTPSEFRVLDNERVLVFGHMSGRGRISDASGETEFVNLIQIRDGSVTRLVMYSDRDRALATLGLEE